MNTTLSPDDLLTTEQVSSDMLDDAVTPETLRKWRRIGRGPVFKKLGMNVRYRRGDVQAWLDANTYSSNYTRAPVAA
jgi:Helix-turn-helix domain